MCNAFIINGVLLFYLPLKKTILLLKKSILKLFFYRLISFNIDHLNVRPCDRLVDIILGNLYKTTILDVWNGETVPPILENERYFSYICSPLDSVILVLSPF